MAGVGKKTVLCYLGFQGILLLLSFMFLRYDKDADARTPRNGMGHSSPESPSVTTINQRYAMFQDVHVMIFVGFGFLMTFLRKYGFSSVGFTFLLAATIIQWGLICQGLFDLNKDDYKIHIDVRSLISADVLSAAILISMGAVLGKTTPLQLLIMGIIETVLFCVNEKIGHNFQVTDAGDSIFVHVFGAYFGLAVSQVLGKPRQTDLEGSSYTSDLFAMIGSVFLWLFWPSFNAAATANGGDQQRAVINTYLSIAASCVTAFAISALVTHKNKFNMVHIQNSTLAGGVAIGTVADLMIQPYGAVLVGSLAGILSVLGYKYLQPFLLKRIGLHDTCGVHNLHGMPGVLAGIVGALAALVATESDYSHSLYEHFPARAPKSSNPFLHDLQTYRKSILAGSERTAGEQALYQLLAIVTTLAVAIVGGAITGMILKMSTTLRDKAGEEDIYDDEKHWEIEMELEEKAEIKTFETHEQTVDDKC
uniref:Ammonium transporter AmtB-like domain-containing protein n=1 Tax=Clastoptera arizonana TaxID=38151 RepID=A0A1B6EAQ8_9HEMI